MSQSLGVVFIRWMLRRDMLDVLRIERDSFEFPWNESDFIRCLRERSCIGLVAEHEDKVAGFVLYEVRGTRMHVLNFAVDPNYRRLGVGGQMVTNLVHKLSVQRRKSIFLEVRESNLAAQVFFRKSGFRAVSTLHNYYSDTTEDAYLMRYSVDVRQLSKLACSDCEHD